VVRTEYRGFRLGLLVSVIFNCEGSPHGKERLQAI
jgi:hypothetical protein